MEGLPRRGAAARLLGLPLPPARMPALRRLRPLKRWTYVGIFGSDLMLCAGDARIGPLPVRWWAIAEPDRPLEERTAVLRPAGVALDDRCLRVDGRMDLELEPAGDPVEVVSPSGSSFIWTRKLPIAARGWVHAGGGRRELEARGILDESAGYHAHATAWRWSAGIGESTDGRSLTWNLVTGVHDAPRDSERTIWVDGRAAEAGPVEFEPGLAGLRLGDGARMEFSEWSARTSQLSLGPVRNVYRQPFGTFSGDLGAGLPLAWGRGVMEEHDARW